MKIRYETNSLSKLYFFPRRILMAFWISKRRISFSSWYERKNKHSHHSRNICRSDMIQINNYLESVGLVLFCGLGLQIVLPDMKNYYYRAHCIEIQSEGHNTRNKNYLWGKDRILLCVNIKNNSVQPQQPIRNHLTI